MNWAQYIKQLKLDFKMTLGELATRLKIPYRTLEDWKDGKRFPDAAGQAILLHFRTCKKMRGNKKIRIGTPKT